VNIKGKQLEELVLKRAAVDERAGRYCLGRYGVMAVLIKGEWHPIVSLPDFEGVTADGHQFIFDAKVCSAASYPLSGGTSKSLKNQYRHMRRRAVFNVTCFLLMHFNARALKTKADEELTVLFPIGDNDFWAAYEAENKKSITRDDAREYGVVVNWGPASPRAKLITPDLYTALTELQNRKAGK
jgi:penicillin-binding protein-related factor A (putative recombinase)